MVKDYLDYIVPKKTEQKVSLTYDYYVDATTMNYFIIGVFVVVLTVIFFQKMLLNK